MTSLVGQIVAFGYIAAAGLRTHIDTSAFVDFCIRTAVAGSTTDEMPASSPGVGNFGFASAVAAIVFVTVKDCGRFLVEAPN